MNPLPITSVVFTELRPPKPSQRNIALGIMAGVALMLLDFYLLKYGIWLTVPFVAVIRFFSWWQQRNNKIAFYADHLLISKEGKETILPYATIEAIDPTEEDGFSKSTFLVVTRAEDQLLIDIQGYNKTTVWNAIHTYLPAAFAKDAFLSTTKFQRELQIAENLLNRDGVLPVSVGSPAIWRGFIIVTLVVGVVLSIGVRDFVGMCVMGVMSGMGVLFLSISGNIEISRDSITFQGAFRRWQIQWDEIEMAKTDFNNMVGFGNAEKWVTIPAPEKWSGNNRSAARAFLALQIERRTTTLQQSKMPLFPSGTKNTLVQRKKDRTA